MTAQESETDTALRDVQAKFSIAADNKFVADLAREQHDVFNLFALIPLIILTIINWNWSLLLSGALPEDAWTGQFFAEYCGLTMLYFAGDMLWVACVPVCVKSPGIIIKHHIVTLLAICVPLCVPELRWCMGACMSVEINTWFLIARRHIFKRGKSSATLLSVVTVSFFSTWVLLRLILYPILLVLFIQKGFENRAAHGSFGALSFVVPIHFTLCALNFKWSADLLVPKIKSLFTDGSGVQVAEKGL